MEEKESKKYIKYTPDPVEHDLDLVKVDEALSRFMVEIREEQDRIIMQTIQHIGGSRYEYITIDKNKTLDALSKAMDKKVVLEKHNENDVKVCPTCGRWLRVLPLYPEYMDAYRYCGKCGQKLDWSEVK
jgi:NADH pyrophosphatase NudC (nudix superfamily)